MKTLLTILLTATLWCRAEVPPFQTKTFEFEHVDPTNQVIEYRIYQVSFPVTVASTNYLFSTTSNRFSITNMLPVPQRVFVTTSNAWGEGVGCIPVLMPTRPAPVTNLKPIYTTLRISVPAIIEATTDFITQQEQWTFYAPTNGVQVARYKHLPTEDFKFFQSRGLPPSVVPPPLP